MILNREDRETAMPETYGFRAGKLNRQNLPISFLDERLTWKKQIDGTLEQRQKA